MTASASLSPFVALNPDAPIGRRIVHVFAQRARVQLAAEALTLECRRCGDALTIADRQLCRECRRGSAR